MIKKTKRKKKKPLTECQKRAKRYKSLTKDKGLLDKAWSLAVRSHGECEYCGRTDTLNPHHIFSRSNRSTRWYMPNGICICAKHHVFCTKFSAHLTPTIFTKWIIELRGEEWHEELRKRALIVFKPTLQELEDLLEKLENV